MSAWPPYCCAIFFIWNDTRAYIVNRHFSIVDAIRTSAHEIHTLNTLWQPMGWTFRCMRVAFHRAPRSDVRVHLSMCVCVCGMVNTLLLNNKHNKTSRRQVKDSIHSLTVTIMWEWTAGSRLGFWHIQFYVPHMYGYTYRIRITFIHPEWTRRIQHFSFHLFARKYFERRKNFSIRNFLESLKHGNFFNSHYFRYQKYSLCCVNNVDCMEFH